MAELPCPTCGSPLEFLDQYQRYYCHRCLQYAPEGYGDYGAQTCPTCGGILSYVRQYGRMYCYRCSAYPPEQAAPKETPASAGPAVAAEAPPSTSAPTPTTSAAESAPLPGPAVTALLATTSAAASMPSPEAPPEPATQQEKTEPEEPAPTPQPETESPIPSEAVAAQETPAEPALPKPSMEMRLLAAKKPAAIRVKLFSLKKAELVDLARVYDLDASGTKDELQQRLLSYLHDLETEGEPRAEEVPPATEPTPAAPAEAGETPAEETPREGPEPAAVPGTPQETKADAWGNPPPTAGMAAFDGRLAQQVAGLGAYAMYDNLLYGQFGVYRSAQQGGAHPPDGSSEDVLHGVAPYWRAALTHDWGASSVELGTYGLSVQMYPSGVTGPTDRYTDLAIDGQYQQSIGEGWLAAHAIWIHERQTLNATFAGGGSANSFNTLEVVRGDATFSTPGRVAGTVGYFSTTGTTDAGLYGAMPVMGSANGSPKTAGLIGELSFMPWLNTRFGAQYTLYTKFNGGTTNYDGSGRSASDNNTLYVYTWLIF